MQLKKRYTSFEALTSNWMRSEGELIFGRIPWKNLKQTKLYSLIGDKHLETSPYQRIQWEIEKELYGNKQK